ncbi:acetylornithine deacetylase ArgE [Acetobacter estunensis NRIC 0472]|uniref:Acetylornithine deacetylase n=1 Tax=Acetobacter estunensis TaxID=104097 RepID=A0A967B571_9PROT|nr:acetylornithine deacetylase [Acetobacter estunensis]NHO52366.1 acetylornithine deacetylase [Acetobacter estunensis]GBQ25785.1 acetylornithine deacetylase ArgE [Acetobacter estunensis NRIC 0472]
MTADFHDLSVREILDRLIAFRTLCRTENAELIDWVETFLRSLGARCHRVPGKEAGQFNLFASIGPDTPDGVVLSAHSDVVPVEGQPWTTDPFVLTERDGKLYGRGSSDMKGFLACMLMAACHAARSSLRAPLHLAISHDEEIGCVGVHSLLRDLAANGFQAQGCVIGEPTGLHAVSGHKGKLAARITCHGLAAHSANPSRGCNTIGLATDMVKVIEALQEELKDAGAHDESYEVPFSTLQVGLIRGGVALNIVPDLCEVQFEMRLLPGVSPQPVLDRLRQEADRLCAQHSHARIEIETLNTYPGLHTPDRSPFLHEIMRITGDNAPSRIGFGTEGGLFHDYLDMPVVVCGPGSIDRAHKADEFILPEELNTGVRFVERIIDMLAHS